MIVFAIIFVFNGRLSIMPHAQEDIIEKTTTNNDIAFKNKFFEIQKDVDEKQAEIVQPRPETVVQVNTWKSRLLVQNAFVPITAWASHMEVPANKCEKPVGVNIATLNFGQNAEPQQFVVLSLNKVAPELPHFIHEEALELSSEHHRTVLQSDKVLRAGHARDFWVLIVFRGCLNCDFIECATGCLFLDFLW
jgi:hypothetical protein